MYESSLTSSGWSVILVSPVSITGAITLSFWSVPLGKNSNKSVHNYTELLIHVSTLDNRVYRKSGNFIVKIFL